MKSLIWEAEILIEYNNDPPLTLMQTCERKLRQLESLDKLAMNVEELKSIKNEIRDLCLLLHGIEVSKNHVENKQ